MILLASLAVFSGLSLNLLLTFALGTAGVTGDKLQKDETRTEQRRDLPLFQFAVFFISVLFLWIFFANLLSANWKGFAECFLIFPFSALSCIILERLGERVYPRALSGMYSRQGGIKKVYHAFTAYDGLVPVSLLLTLALAGSFAGALIITLSFVLGNMAAMLILNEIRRRSTLEWVPRYLRGSPLILISMGLLSLISAAAAGICLKILEVF